MPTVVGLDRIASPFTHGALRATTSTLTPPHLRINSTPLCISLRDSSCLSSVPVELITSPGSRSLRVLEGAILLVVVVPVWFVLWARRRRRRPFMWSTFVYTARSGEYSLVWHHRAVLWCGSDCEEELLRDGAHGNETIARE